MKDKKYFDEDISREDLVAEVSEKEKASDSGKQRIKSEGERFSLIVAGSFLYGIGLNLFVQPLHFYAGGFTGVAQLITYALRNIGISPRSFDLTGLLYYLLNIPFILIALKSMRKRFILRTLLAVTLMTLMMTLIPVPARAIFPDKLGSAGVGGLLVGIGTGFILRSGACDGGINLVAMLILNKRTGTTIGTIGAIFSLAFYGLCLFLFDIPTVIYSLIYAMVVSFSCDRIHTQTINSQAVILTKTSDLEKMQVEIMGRLGRGVTRLKAEGAFTGENVNILIVYLSKYEVMKLRLIVKKLDPEAFIAVNNGVQVDGNFLRKLS